MRAAKTREGVALEKCREGERWETTEHMDDYGILRVWGPLFTTESPFFNHTKQTERMMMWRGTGMSNSKDKLTSTLDAPKRPKRIKCDLKIA